MQKYSCFLGVGKKKRHGKARIEINRSFTFLVWVTHVRLSRLSLAGPPLLMPCIIATTCFGSSSLIFTLIIPLFLRFAFVLSFSFGCKRICRERKKKKFISVCFLFYFLGKTWFFFFWTHEDMVVDHCIKGMFLIMEYTRIFQWHFFP